MRLTGLSEYEYNLLQFEVAIAFLKHECNHDETGVSIMSRTDLFWSWWKNLYQQRDTLWLQAGYKTYDEYKKWQSAKNINLYPNRFIYEKAYSEFIATLPRNNAVEIQNK